MTYYRVSEFYGIQQQTDGSLLPVESASDARNIDTSDGNLSVAKGYTKHISVIIPGSDRIIRVIQARTTTEKVYVVTANNIYSFTTLAWNTVYTFATPLTTSQIGYIQTLIGTDDYLIIATGETQMIKIKISDDTSAVFGTGAYSFSGTVSSYDAGTLTVTLSDTLSAEAQRHAPLDGITIDGTWLEVASATSSTVVLADTPDTAPVATDTATIRGGGSDAYCNYCGMYFGRFFAAGDPSNPSRLYWSAVPGDGRTIEDWLAVEGSADASGGYTDIGDNSQDSILAIDIKASKILIHKRFSVYTLRGDRPSTYTVEPVVNSSEQMSSASVVVLNDIPYWLTMSGIQAYDDTGVQPINNGIKYLNSFMQTVYSVLTSRGVHCQNVLYFTCKVDSSSTYDDTMIVIDLSRSQGDTGISYMIRDGFEIADMTVHDGHIYLVNGNRYVYEFNLGDDYDGTDIDAYWTTQKTELSAKDQLKHFKTLMLRATSGQARITINPASAGKFVDVDFSDENDGFTKIAPSVPPARTMQFKFENISGGYFSITGGIEVSFDTTYTPR